MRLIAFLKVTLVGALLAGPLVGPTSTPAYALGAGQVCLFNAPSGAPTPVGNMGHVGWAFLEGGTTNWTYGATENRSGQWTVDAGQNTDSWIKNGTWSQVTADFKNALSINGHYYHDHGYYTQYRCRNTAQSSVGAAVNEARTQQNNGYNFINNNCLTKSINIFWSYDNSLHDLPYAGTTGPNWYFDNELTGFGAKVAL